MKTLTEKHYQHLVITQSLFLFYNNFDKGNIITEMMDEDNGFKNAWTELYDRRKLEHEKNGGFFTINDKEVYHLINSKLTYKAQALLIEKVLIEFEEEAKQSIDFAIKIEKIKSQNRR